MAFKYEIRNKYVEAAHAIFPGKCSIRKMTDEDWQKYGPKVNKRRKGFILKGG